MYKLKSAIILKDRVFIPDYDSHSDMLAELGIEDSRANAERLFVRAELSPRDGDAFSPVDAWEFNVDQDIRPEWFVESYEKERMVAAVKEWAKGRIHVGVDGLVIESGSGHYIKDCYGVRIGGDATVKHIRGDATVKCIYGSATVKCICGDATVERIYGDAMVECIYGSATVKCICGDATVKCICDSATVEYIRGDATVKCIGGDATVERIYGSATVKCIGGNATVISSPYGWANKGNVKLSDNATFKDCESKTIYQAGDWKFCAVPAKEATP